MLLVPALLLMQGTTTPHSSAELVSSVRQAVAGSPFNVAVRIRLDEGWHTYWQNPGDSGSATSVAWKLPKGWTVMGPRFATPHRLEANEMVTYGYEEVATLLFTITPPAKAATATLTADVEWLVCEEACLPASAQLKLPVRVGATKIPGTSLAAEWEAAPKTLTGGWAERSTEGFRLGLTLPAALEEKVDAKDTYFFPQEPGVLNHAAPQAFSLNGRELVGTLPKSPYASAAVPRLRGVLVVKQGLPGYLLDVPVR